MTATCHYSSAKGCQGSSARARALPFREGADRAQPTALAGAYPVTMEGICDRTDSARTASGWPVELSAFDPLMPPVKSTFYKWNPQSFHALYAPPRFAVSLKHRTEPDSSSEHTMAIPTGKRIPRPSLKKLRPYDAASRIKNAGLMACARNNDQLEPGDKLTDKLNQVSSVPCSADSHSAQLATPSIITVDQLSAEHNTSTPELPPDNRLNITQGSSSADSTSVTSDQLMPGAAPGAGKLSVPPHAAANGADSVAQVRSSTGTAARPGDEAAPECRSIADSEYAATTAHIADSLSEGSADTLSEGSADELYDPHADALSASCAASLSGKGPHGGSGSTSDGGCMAGTSVRSGEGVRPQGTSTAYGPQDAQACDCGALGVQPGSPAAAGISTGSWHAAGADATAAVTRCEAAAAMALRPGMNSTADDEDILHYSMRASNSENLQVSRRGIHRYRVLSTQSMMDIINSEVMLIKRLMQTTEEENRRFIDPMVRAMVEIGSSMPNSAWYHCAMFMGIVQHSVNVALYSVSYYAWRLRASTLMAPEYASGRLRSPFVYPPARRRAIIDSKARLYAALLTRLPEEQAVEALPQLTRTCTCPVPHQESNGRWQDGTFIARALQAGLSAAARGLSLKQPEQAILAVISSSALSARNQGRLRNQLTASSQRHPYCAPGPVSGAAPFPGAASGPAADCVPAPGRGMGAGTGTGPGSAPGSAPGVAPWPGSGAGPACTSNAHADPWSPATAGDSLAFTAGAARTCGQGRSDFLADGQGRAALRQGNSVGCAPAAAAASSWAAQSRKMALDSGGHWALAAASVWSGEAADTVEVADARAFWHPLYNSALPESSYMPENIATWYGLDLFERARICELIFLTPASGEHLGLCRGPAHTRSDWASGAHSQAFTQEAQPCHERRAPGTYAPAQNQVGRPDARGPGARWPGTGIPGAGGPGLTGRGEAVGMRADGSCVTSLWDLFVRQSIAQMDLDVVHHKADKRPWKVPPYNKRSKLRKGQIFMLFEARMRARGRLSERQINIALLSAVLLNGFLHDLAKVDLQVLITAENGRQYQGLTSGMTLQEFAQINGSPWLYMRRCKTARPGWRRRRRRDKTRWRPMNHCDVGHMHCIDMLKRLCPEALWLVNQAMDLYRFDRKWSGLDRITKCYDHTTDTRYARRHSKRWDYHIRTLIHEYVLMRTRALIMVSSELRRCTSAMAQLQGARADLLGRLAAASAKAAAAHTSARACSGQGAGPAAGTAAGPGCAARGPESIPGRPAMRGMHDMRGMQGTSDMQVMQGTSGMHAMQGTEGVSGTGSRAELNGHGRDSSPWEHCAHIRCELEAVERELQRWGQAMSIFERSAQVLTVNKGSSDIFIRGRNVLLRTGSAAMYSLLNTMYEFIYGPSFVSHCSECSSMKKALVEMNLQSYRLLVYSKIKRYVVAAQDEITVLQGYTISSAGLNYGHNASWYIISSRMDQYSMSDEDILQSICSKLAAYGIRRKGNIIHTPPGQAQRLLQAWRFGCDPDALAARDEATASAAAATGAESDAPVGTACPAAQTAPADCVPDAGPAVLADCAAPAQAADTAASAQAAGSAHAENPGKAHSPVVKVSSSATPGRLSARDRTAAAVSTGASLFKGAVPVAAADSDRAVRSGQAIRPHGAVQGAAGSAPAGNSSRAASAGNGSPAAPAGSSAAPAAGTARAAASATASGGELSFDDSGIPSFIDDICPDDEFDSDGLWTVVE